MKSRTLAKARIPSRISTHKNLDKDSTTVFETLALAQKVHPREYKGNAGEIYSIHNGPLNPFSTRPERR